MVSITGYKSMTIISIDLPPCGPTSHLLDMKRFPYRPSSNVELLIYNLHKRVSGDNETTTERDIYIYILVYANDNEDIIS